MSHPVVLHQLADSGRVAAGGPIGADSLTDEQMLVDRTMFSPMPDYLLKVKGQSMQDDGIWDDDLVAVRRTNIASNNDIAVARIDDEITIKRTKNEVHFKINKLFF